MSNHVSAPLYLNHKGQPITLDSLYNELSALWLALRGAEKALARLELPRDESDNLPILLMATKGIKECVTRLEPHSDYLDNMAEKVRQYEEVQEHNRQAMKGREEAIKSAALAYDKGHPTYYA